MEFLLLGPVELSTDDGPVDLRSDRVRGILALLILELGAIVPTEKLIELIWDGNPPLKARQTLTSRVSTLRGLLKLAPDNGARIENRAHGYVLRADRARVDLHRFRDLRREASELARRGQIAAAAELLRQAEALWRGPALAGLKGEAMGRVRFALEEERWSVTRQRIEYDLTCGREAELVGELQQLCAIHDLDATPAAYLMRALYGVGRQGDALAVYRDFHERHTRELGTDPGAALAELHARILRRDPSLIEHAESRPAESGRPVPRDTLPPDPAQFIGRASEIHQLVTAEGRPCIQAITGMPGIGKSTLAVRTAHALRQQYPDAQLFLGLRAHDIWHPPLDPAEALHHLLSMIGIPDARIPQSLSDRREAWRAELDRRKMIVILDDAAGPEQVQPLLPVRDCASQVIITSRADLGLAGGRSLEVLRSDEAAELFARTAGPLPPGARDQVTEIVRLCGGLPLAIQLSARRVLGSGPDTLDEVLAEVLEELSSRVGRRPAADGTGDEIALAFELSYRSLSAGSRNFFKRIGLSPGADITEYAAAALAGTSLPDAGRALAELVNRHLLEAAGRGLRFHDLIRNYAAACAHREDSEADRRAATDRLLHFYLRAVEQADSARRGKPLQPVEQVAEQPSDVPALGSPKSATEWLEREWRSILDVARYAAAHERKRQSARLIHLLDGFLTAAGHWKQVTEAHQLALQACRDLDDPAGVARASLDLSLIIAQAGNLPDASRHAERAAAVFKSISDWTGHAEALNHCGRLQRLKTEYRQALAYHLEANELYRAAGDQHGEAVTLNDSGIACYYLSRYPEAFSRIDMALGLYRETGDHRGEAMALANLGTLQGFHGLHRDAMDSYQRSLANFQELGGEQQMEAQVHLGIGWIHRYKGDNDGALSAQRLALAMFRRIGDLPGEGDALNEIGETLNAMEDRAGALAHHRQAADVAETLGDPRSRVTAMRGMAEALGGTGRDDEAAEQYRQALHLAREIGDQNQEGKVLEGMAGAAIQAQDSAMARIYLQQALDIYKQLGVPEAEAIELRLETLPTGPSPRRDIA